MQAFDDIAERRLNGGGENNGTGVMTLFQSIKQSRYEAEFPRLEFGRVFRAIDSCEIEYEILHRAVSTLFL